MFNRNSYFISITVKFSRYLKLTCVHNINVGVYFIINIHTDVSLYIYIYIIIYFVSILLIINRAFLIIHWTIQLQFKNFNILIKLHSLQKLRFTYLKTLATTVKQESKKTINYWLSSIYQLTKIINIQSDPRGYFKGYFKPFQTTYY